MKRAIRAFVAVLTSFSIPFVIYSSLAARANEPEQPGTTSTQSGYLLRDSSGQLAVFDINNPMPLEVFDIMTNTLPQEDYLLLLEGIYVETEEDLQKLIEDFTG